MVNSFIKSSLSEAFINKEKEKNIKKKEEDKKREDKKIRNKKKKENIRDIRVR